MCPGYTIPPACDPCYGNIPHVSETHNHRNNSLCPRQNKAIYCQTYKNKNIKHIKAKQHSKRETHKPCLIVCVASGPCKSMSVLWRQRGLWHSSLCSCPWAGRVYGGLGRGQDYSCPSPQPRSGITPSALTSPFLCPLVHYNTTWPMEMTLCGHGNHSNRGATVVPMLTTPAHISNIL
jgi:hypothetical protein